MAETFTEVLDQHQEVLAQYPDLQAHVERLALTRGETIPVKEIGETASSIIDDSEALHNAGSLQSGTVLEATLRREMAAKPDPSSVSLVGPEPRHRDVDLTDVDDNASDEALREAAIDKYKQNKLYSMHQSAWWKDINDKLGTEQDSPLTIWARHTMHAFKDGQELDQRMDVFEIGATPIDEASLQTALKTLEMIDQFSGGILSTDNHRSPLVLTSSPIESSTHDDGTKQRVVGVNSDDMTLIDISRVKERAGEVGADEQVLLAVAITHEVLGHALDKSLRWKADSFGRYFTYSDEKRDDEQYDVHIDIQAKNGDTSTRPVRKYGSHSVAEDMATAVETTVGQAMGWKEVMDQHPEYKSEVDDYRRDLVLGLFEEAAQLAVARGAEGVPGLVGSEVSYRVDSDGELQPVPARTFKVIRTDGESAVTDEIQKIVDKYNPPTELVASVSRKSDPRAVLI